MTTQALAQQMVELLRKGEFEAAQRAFLSEHAVSIEPNPSFFPEKTIGLNSILAKGAKFRESIESVNTLNVSDPLVAGNVFAITFTLDANFKGAGQTVFNELCLFSVADGKIVQETYFY